jgi:hypothetical protein
MVRRSGTETAGHGAAGCSRRSTRQRSKRLEIRERDWGAVGCIDSQRAGDDQLLQSGNRAVRLWGTAVYRDGSQSLVGCDNDSAIYEYHCSRLQRR